MSNQLVNFPDNPAYRGEGNSAAESYPTSEAGWNARYAALRRMYLVGDYSTAEREYYKLFEARDDDDKRIDWTRRLFGVGAFLVNTDARALLGGRTMLELPRGLRNNAAHLAAGETVWRRSSMALQLPMAAKMTACMGDYWVEAVRTNRAPPYATTLVFYDPENVTPIYDELNPTKLVKAVIDVDYIDEADYIEGGTLPSHHFTRTITATDVTVEVDGKLRPEFSGPHRAGVCPIEHLRWMPFSRYEHSLSAMHGIDVPLMRIDSAVCQIAAGLTRFGNPTIVMTGARLTATNAANVGRLGRVMHGLPADAAVSYLQTASGPVADGLEVIREVMAHIRETRPEYLFANSGAGESGAARSFLAASFTSMINEVRGHWFAAIERITGIAVALDAGVAYDDAEHAFQLDAPPPVPVDVKAEIEALYLAAGDMKRADRIRKLQQLGMLDASHDPEVYAIDVEDETSAKARSMLE